MFSNMRNGLKQFVERGFFTYKAKNTFLIYLYIHNDNESVVFYNLINNINDKYFEMEFEEIC